MDIPYLHLDIMVHPAGGRVNRDSFCPSRDTVYSAGRSKSTETIRRGRALPEGGRARSASQLDGDFLGSQKSPDSHHHETLLYISFN
jgi:hypothetical protein